jgi:prepilin-type N-terminal cleavage/methylation domain-containing protein
MPTLSVGRTSKQPLPDGRGSVTASARGVTLVEMMVVMTIIALMAGISFPAVSAGIDSVRLRSATDSLASFLNAAVNRAERRQQAVEVVISPKDNASRRILASPAIGAS